MPKNYEKINLANPDHEEEERLFDGDKSRESMPVDQIPDEAGENEEDSVTIPEEHTIDEDEEKIEQLKQEIKFHQEVQGVASVGPDVEGETISVDHVVIGEKAPVKKPARISRRKTDKQITSMSPGQVTRESRSGIKSNKDRHGRNSGMEHDNLKTMPEEKKQRTFRQKIRDFFNKPI